jgi:glycosyltransferase
LKISIITVAYNSAETITDTLRSIAAQDYADIEHIVIDGASKDDTLNLVRTHGTRVARLISEPDRGIYDAMNKGLAAASGDFVGFLNADDMLASTQTVADIARALAETDADAIFGDLVYVRQDRPDQVVRYWHSGEFQPRRLRYGWMPPHPTLYVRRARLLALGGFDIRLRIAADYDLMLRLFRQSDFRVSYLPKLLVRMRTGGASNRSVSALWRKSREDLGALRRSGTGGLGTLLCKNARKLPQFFSWPSTVP